MLSNVLPAALPPQVPAGWQTGPPDFVGVGAMKAGTTWWWAVLTRHPAIATPREPPAGQSEKTLAELRQRQYGTKRPPAGEPITALHRRLYGTKEVHFFDHYGQVEQIDPAAYHRYFPRPPGHLAGEWTPRYMYDFWTPPMLRAAAPNTKLLVLLRDPLERLLSALGHNRAWAPSAPPAAVIDHQFHRSLYWRQLQWLLAHFRREQLLVLQYEQCVADPAAQARRTFTFLGLDPQAAPSAGELTKRVGRSYTRPDLSPATRDAFVRALAPDLARLLEEFPDLDANLWPSLRTLA
ncbi:sulfotransferase [Nonomuraea sp. FMUSA5-5]|uniref:Sulfotransferase n=1 Tax=Nonomuraea composti TaxID=2720023 RepID=A0ABX1BNF0_9ACTN|nr:sulfotransferase [Nonomuraea sp. FMUSA5-5]NJP98567.1 sulfotransferase [Nonomuraea sp. FMUSA5-5]